MSNDGRGIGRQASMRKSGLPAALAGLVALSGCGYIPTAHNPGDQTASTVRAPSLSPSPTIVSCPGPTLQERAAPAATYDAARGEIVVFGGSINGGSTANTVVYIGSCWNEIQATVGPAPRDGASLVYDPDLQLSLLVGGRKNDPNGPQTIPGDVWTWNGRSWTQLANAPHFSDAAAAYDEVRHVVVVLGAAREGVGTWTWDGSAWKLASSGAPYPRIAPSICFDRSHGTVLLFGGSGLTPLNDTWLWNGTAWTEQSPAHKPAARFLSATACGTRPLVFGGLGSFSVSPPLSDTWTWTGSDWQQLLTSHTPTADTSFQPFGVFDGAHSLVVGGLISGYVWMWNGTDWASTT